MLRSFIYIARNIEDAMTNQYNLFINVDDSENKVVDCLYILFISVEIQHDVELKINNNNT